MASFVSYAIGSAAAYWLGSNLLYRGANVTIDWLLNKHANPEIKETHTVKSIMAMLHTYSNLNRNHPAYDAMLEVRDALNDLQVSIERAKLKYEAHKIGYISRFRTFDARKDNIIIETKTVELMSRLDIFTKLVILPDFKQ